MDWDPTPAKYPPYLRPKIRRRRGCGFGSTYKPWNGRREGPRKGTTGILLGLKTGRRHELRSIIRRAYYLLRERDETVIDIREDFPILHIFETLKLCADHGVEHPYSGHQPEPFLIDFLITRGSLEHPVYEARSLGLIDATADSTYLVVRDWCESKNIEWKLVDTEPLNQALIDSLMYLRGWRLHQFEPVPEAVNAFCSAFNRIYRRHLTLKEILELCSAKLGQDFARCDDHFRYAAWTKALAVDPCHPIALDSPITLLKRV